jgi:hypothetical protein
VAAATPALMAPSVPSPIKKEAPKSPTIRPVSPHNHAGFGPEVKSPTQEGHRSATPDLAVKQVL